MPQSPASTLRAPITFASALLTRRASSSLPVAASTLSSRLQQQPTTSGQIAPIARPQRFSTQPAKMSTMPASHGHSQPCCNIPPVVSKGYNAKGTYETIGGYKTYVTGPADAKKAVVVIMDIFGFFEQTLQGSDILAYSGEEKYKVFIADWFNGKPCPIEIYPPDNEDKQKQLGDFFGTYPPPKVADQVPGFVDGIKAKNPQVEKFAILGYCWGGKVATLATTNTNIFSVGASVHPAMVDPKDAEGVKVPFIMLASGDEPKDDVKKFEAALKVEKMVRTYSDQIHGWMAARGDLSNPAVKKEYEAGYKDILDFSAKNF